MRKYIRASLISLISLGVGSLLVAASTSPAGAASTAGVCPDGSAFVVQRRDSAPCENPRFVHPSDLPPLRPELLPKPYMWYLDQERRDTNNPYYLVEQAQKMRALRAKGARPREAQPRVKGAVRGVPAFAQADSRSTEPFFDAPLLELDERELGDLVKLIALRQNLAPATLRVKDARGNDQMRIRFAHSDSFESRVLDAVGSTSSEERVLVFYARAITDADFHPNFLVVQNGQTFRPDKADPSEVGVLVGEAGTIDAGLLVMGYVVIPARFHPGRTLEIYWNDRSLAATLRP